MRNMENIKSYILKIVFLLSITININAGILTHEFRTEEFGNVEKTDKDIVILMHGIYSKLDNLEYIEKKLEKKCLISSRYGRRLILVNSIMFSKSP